MIVQRAYPVVGLPGCWGCGKAPHHVVTGIKNRVECAGCTGAAHALGLPALFRTNEHKGFAEAADEWRQLHSRHAIRGPNAVPLTKENV